jgi:plasmid stabilization system protein ParE
MPEIIWKQGAENDLLQIFAELEEDFSPAASTTKFSNKTRPKLTQAISRRFCRDLTKSKNSPAF